MLSRRRFVLGAGLIATAGVTYGGYRYWRWDRGRSPRIFERDIFQIDAQEMTGRYPEDAAHTGIPDRETAETVLSVDEEIDGFLRETDFDEQSIVGVLTGAQCAAALTVDSVEHDDDHLDISLSFSYPAGPDGDDFCPQSVLIRLAGDELPTEVEITVAGPP